LVNHSVYRDLCTLYDYVVHHALSTFLRIQRVCNNLNVNEVIVFFVSKQKIIPALSPLPTGSPDASWPYTCHYTTADLIRKNTNLLSRSEMYTHYNCVNIIICILHCGRRRFRNDSSRHGVLSVVNVCRGNARDLRGQPKWIQGDCVREREHDIQYT